LLGNVKRTNAFSRAEQAMRTTAIGIILVILASIGVAPMLVQTEPLRHTGSPGASVSPAVADAACGRADATSGLRGARLLLCGPEIRAQVARR
jgi:hypothetical protein